MITMDIPTGFNWLFSGFGIMFLITAIPAILIFILLFTTIFKNMRRDSKAPRLTVQATVLAKREHYSARHRHHAQTAVGSLSTYYATFEVESGDRMELIIPYNEFGLLIEGDRGNLTFQGKRYVSFERQWQ